MVRSGLPLLLFLLCQRCTAELTGDAKIWDSIFSSQSAHLLADRFAWTEGPTWTRKGLLFSDTVTGTMWQWDEPDSEAEPFLRSAGGCPHSTDDGGAMSWHCPENQAEPGSNGMVTVDDDQVVVCQHGSRRIVLLDLETKKTTPLAATYDGRRLNGPNDVVMHPSGTLVFTDPYYAFMEKSRFYDDVYTDAKSALGYAGIYSLSSNGRLRLLDSSMERPNGLALLLGKPDRLIVSECCQGHSTGCPAGTARWKIFQLDAKRGKLHLQHTIEHTDDEKRGCADGLKYHRGSGMIVASCPSGVCIVSLSDLRVVAKLHLGFRVSNVGFGGGYAWITGEKRLWRIPLQDHGSSGHRTEL